MQQIGRCEIYFISRLYLSRFPWRALLLLWQLLILLLLLRAPAPLRRNQISGF
jgi:hypothetical protein